MVNLVRHCLGTSPWTNNDLGVAPGTTKVRTCMTSLIFAGMGQVKSPSASKEIVDVDGVAVCNKS